MESNRGGARIGAGRKKTDNVSLCVRMPSTAVERIKQCAAEDNTPIGMWIAKKLGL